ncbi:MAG: aminopeptidase N, partial [Pseudomonadota bacterium]
MMIPTEKDLTPKTIYLKDYLPASYKVAHVNLSFTLLQDKTIVKSEVQYLKNPESASNDLILNGESQTLISVELDNKPFDGYIVDDDTLTINNAGEKFTL